MKVMVNGKPVDWVKFVMRMDDTLANEVYRAITPCSEQEAADAYCQAHDAHFGKQFRMEE